MAYIPTKKRRAKTPIDQTTGGDKGWPLGYVSRREGSLTPRGALIDMTNMDLAYVAHPRIRPPLIPYGQPLKGTCLGRPGSFTKTVAGKPEYHEISMQAVLLDEIQTLSITGSPTGGTFTLTYDGQTTAGIAYNASASTVQAALEALSNLASGDVVCTGGALPSNAVVITFGGALGDTDVTAITANSAGLTGGTTPTATITESRKGGLYGVIHTRKDGGEWIAADLDVLYDPGAEASFAQAANRVYIANGEDNLSFLDIVSGNITQYVAISSPGTITVTPTGLSGSAVTLYYWVSAINGSGETLATAAPSQAVLKARNEWGTSEYITLSWAAVPGATGYVVYVSERAGSDNAYYLTVTYTNSFKDTGSIAASPLRRPPLGNSTAAPKLSRLFGRNGEIYGVGDVDNPSYLWKDNGPTASGDFFAGYVAIDYGGESLPAVGRAFRDGKGNSVVTVLTQGAPEKAKMFHVGYNLTDIGGETIPVPEVYEANGQSGTISPDGVIEAANSLHYPTGEGFTTNGSAENIPNILATRVTSRLIEPDFAGLNLAAMNKCSGAHFRGRNYWLLPYVSDENNELWIHDLTRNDAWILRWKVAGKYIWTHLDNGGKNHLCVLVGGKILEFDWNYSTPAEDDGVPFSTRLSGIDDSYSQSGIGMASVYMKRFKILRPKGELTASVSVDGKFGTNTVPRTKSYAVDSPTTGFGQYLFGETEFGEDPGDTVGEAKRVEVIKVPVRKKINELRWDITTEKGGSDYTAASTHTEGILISKAFLGD